MMSMKHTVKLQRKIYYIVKTGLDYGKLPENAFKIYYIIYSN